MDKKFKKTIKAHETTICELQQAKRDSEESLESAKQEGEKRYRMLEELKSSLEKVSKQAQKENKKKERNITELK